MLKTIMRMQFHNSKVDDNESIVKKFVAHWEEIPPFIQRVIVIIPLTDILCNFLREIRFS